MEQFWPSDINLKMDTLLKTTNTYITVNHAPSRHTIQTYEVKDGPHSGRRYHIFDCVKGCVVMNYHPGDYQALSSQLTIGRNDAVFQLDEGELYLISEDYRVK